MPGGSIQNENVEVGPLCMYARHITNENSVDDSYPELFDARELGDSDGGRVAASHGAHLDVHLEVALDSERKTVFDEGFSPSGTVDTKELFLNFGGSRPFLMEDFIALPIPQKNFVQMLPLPLVLALVFFTRVGSSWRRQKTTCGSIVCHYMNVSHLFCTNTPYTTSKNGQQQRQ